MNKILHWGATFSVNLAMKGNKGVLSVPIYSYIDRANMIKPISVSVNEWNEMRIELVVCPVSEKTSDKIDNVRERKLYDLEQPCPFNDLK